MPEPTTELTSAQITSLANTIVTTLLGDLTYISPRQAAQKYDSFALIVIMSNENAIAFPMMDITSIAGGYLTGVDLQSLAWQIYQLLSGAVTPSSGSLPANIAVARMLGANSDQDIIDVLPLNQISYVTIIGKRSWATASQ